MAKGEQRGNREAKKPKQEKPKAAPAASPFAKQDTGAQPSGRAPERSRGPLLATAPWLSVQGDICSSMQKIRH